MQFNWNSRNWGFRDKNRVFTTVFAATEHERLPFRHCLESSPAITPESRGSNDFFWSIDIDPRLCIDNVSQW